MDKLESAKDKQLLNIRLIEELQDTIGNISKRKQYLHEYWYNLKYYVRALHAAYCLLFKLLQIHGTSSLCTKFNYHSLINGPQPIAQNLQIFSHLAQFIELQLPYVRSVIVFHLEVKMQNEMTQILHRLVKFFDCVIWLDDVTWKYTLNGLPIKYDFI